MIATPSPVPMPPTRQALARALERRSRSAKVSSPASSATAMPARALLWTAAAPRPLLALSLDGRLSRADGAILLVWFAVALIGLIRARPPAGTKGTDPPARSRRFGAARLVGGLALLTGGGVMLGEGIRRVVSNLGVSQTLLGNTAIAASVEAEEVARVAVPSRRGRGDLAVANLLATA